MTAIRTATRWIFDLNPAVIAVVLYLLAAAVATAVAPDVMLGVAAKTWDWLAAVVGAVVGVVS